MQAFKRILVDVDSAAGAHPALERAVILARTCGAALTLTEVATDPEALDNEMVSERRQRLEGMARGVTGVRADAKLLVGRPTIALIQEILRSNHDLLMRSHTRKLTESGAKPFGDTDMELLRKCPCAVMVVRHARPAPHPRIVGAIDASAEEREGRALNERIVRLTIQMAAQLEASSVDLLTAWTPFAEGTVRTHAAADQFAVYVDHARQSAAEGLAQLVKSPAGQGTKIRSVLRRGKPQDVIFRFVVAEGIDLLVMGTVARTGVARMLLGNTAEQVLNKLPCSVLVVKPEGFVSPIRLEES